MQHAGVQASGTRQARRWRRNSESSQSAWYVADTGRAWCPRAEARARRAGQGRAWNQAAAVRPTCGRRRTRCEARAPLHRSTSERDTPCHSARTQCRRRGGVPGCACRARVPCFPHVVVFLWRCATPPRRCAQRCRPAHDARAARALHAHAGRVGAGRRTPRWRRWCTRCTSARAACRVCVSWHAGCEAGRAGQGGRQRSARRESVGATRARRACAQLRRGRRAARRRRAAVPSHRQGSSRVWPASVIRSDTAPRPFVRRSAGRARARARAHRRSAAVVHAGGRRRATFCCRKWLRSPRSLA
jgi:hypothetical protein